MRHFLILLGVVMAGLIGYRMEPGLRFSLTGITPARAAEKARTRAVANEPAVDPATLTPEQLPAKVMLKADVKVADATAEVTMTIPSGTRVSLVRIEGTNAVVSPGAGPYAGSLPISQTDLIEQLAANPSVAVTRPPAPVVAHPMENPGDAVVTSPATPQPAPVAGSTPAAPAPAEPVSAPAPVAAGTDDVVKVMQESLRAGQIKEFTFDQVQEWKAEADETVLGEAFQTGSVSYNMDSIFGTKTVQAKAYIKGGKVQRWIWAKTGKEIQ